MSLCYICNPMCDNCTPKYIYCEECGLRNFLVVDKCLKCGHPFSEADKEAARRDWEEKKAKEAYK